MNFKNNIQMNFKNNLKMLEKKKKMLKNWSNTSLKTCEIMNNFCENWKKKEKNDFKTRINELNIPIC